MHHFIDSPQLRQEKRLIWAATRSVLENVGFSRKHSGKKSRSNWNLFVQLLRIFVVLLRITGFYQKGYGNAKTIQIHELTLKFSNLPPAFHGFRILHLSDLHIDSIPGFVSLLTAKIKCVKFDICLLTGDYRRDITGKFSQILKPIKILSKYIQAPDGTFAVLGNHDTYLMARHEQDSGMNLLINESVEIIRAGQKILITGTDDPFNFYTEPAILCMETKGYDFKIAMVHTPELSKVAAENGYDLYLCGHTHGGQICLKEGHPLISHQFEGKQFNQGLWKMGNMVGYTSRGAGVSGIPIRFNCPPETTVITLLKEGLV
jgi:uncharacterized protein